MLTPFRNLAHGPFDRIGGPGNGRSVRGAFGKPQDRRFPPPQVSRRLRRIQLIELPRQPLEPITRRVDAVDDVIELFGRAVFLHGVLEVEYLAADLGGDLFALLRREGVIVPQVGTHSSRKMDEIQLMAAEVTLTEGLH